MLFIFGGLPGTGKSELAKHIAQIYSATYLRIDIIEQAMRNADLEIKGPEGYQVAYGVAHANLRLGHHVVADSVNPIAITRDAWCAVANSAGAAHCEIEVICSDEAEHRRRVESRQSQIPGLRLPTWQQVMQRQYEPWESAHIVIDTAGQTPGESKMRLEKELKKYCALRALGGRPKAWSSPMDALQR